MAELKAQKREVFGGKLKSLREQGFIPAELYGRGIENIHLSIQTDLFSRIYKEAGEHAVVNVDVGGEVHPALIYDVKFHPITDEVISVDLYQVRMDEKVKAHVPIEFEGESPAVKDLSGVLVKSLDEVEVEALPADIPEKVLVDLSQLTGLEQSVNVKDLPKGDKFEFSTDPETVVASVSAQKEEEEPEEEFTPEDVAVEGEEDKTEEGEDEGANEEQGKQSNKPESEEKRDEAQA